MKTSDVEAALEEMEYSVGENQFGMVVAGSVPAQLSAEGDISLDAAAFDERLERKGLGLYVEFERDHTLEVEIYGRDYKRIDVTIWPESVRLYPRENEPDLGELAQITSAIEQAMDCSLTHDPIDE